jgi:hypothetical protein
VLDAFLDAYARDAEGSELAFLDWVEKTYDPAALNDGFVPASPIARAKMRWKRQRRLAAYRLPPAVGQAARRSPD